MEYWDLYDVNRRPTGRTHCRGERIPKGFYHLVVHLAVFNEKCELLSQQRQTFKKGWSGLWDLTVGGSVQTGENSQEGLRRETLEELGLALPEGQLRPVTTVNGPHYIDDYYVVRMAPELSSLVLQESEVADVRWLSWDELVEMHDAETFIPYNLSFLRYLFDLAEGNTEENFYV